MFTRYRMRKIIRLLEDGQPDEIVSLCGESRNYLKACKILESDGCIMCAYADNRAAPIYVFPGKSTFGYTLKRAEIWLNRVGGFVVGVLTSTLAGVLIIL